MNVNREDFDLAAFFLLCCASRDMLHIEQSNPNSILGILAVLFAVARSGATTTASTTFPVAVNTTAMERDPSMPIAEFIRLPEALDADRVLDEHSRHFLCIPLLRIFNLELREPLAVGEHIALTGSHSHLGEWQLEKSIQMRSLDGDRREWLAKVPICANERIAYRYFVYTLDGQLQKRIRVWEGQHHPRVMESYQIYRQPGTDYFGESTTTAIDVGGRETTWLRYDRLIQLKLIWERQLRIKQQRHARVRLRLEVLSGNDFNDSLIEVSRYAYNRSSFRPQPQHGVVYNMNGGNEDIIIFRILEPLRVRRSYKLRVFNTGQSEIGYVEIFNIDLLRSEGVLRLPVRAAARAFDIGQVVLPYLIVRPLPQAEVLDMNGSFHHFWPLNWPTMHVGNRGVGKTFNDANGTPLVANTIRSFLNVSRLNGEMVKLDVQTTKDSVPVAWHDDGFYTAPQDRLVDSVLDLDYILIRDLTYRELKSSRVFALKGPMMFIEEYTYLNVRDRNVTRRIFPHLTEIFQQLPKSLGLIVDVKWQQFSVGEEVRSPSRGGRKSGFLDKNRNINRLIAITARHGCGRPLIFASFNADICTMLRYKQNLYPVMFLTNGIRKMWQPYKDLRTRSFTNAVNFAQSEFLLGTAPHVGNFLGRSETLTLGLDLTQVVFLWGEELQNAKVLRKFQNLHATGLIYDRIDKHRPRAQRFSFFGVQELKEVFERQCASSLRNASSATASIRVTKKKRRRYITIHTHEL